MLTKSQLLEIKELQRICEAYETIELKLNWEMLENREQLKTTDFFHYENGKLVGFLGLYGFGNKVELCGMVKPEYRRKGIFTKLFQEALQEVQNQNFKLLLLNSPANSKSAKVFLQNIPCQYSFSEYQMKWSETELVNDPSVTIRPSNENDLEDEIQLDVDCFGFNKEDAREYNLHLSNDETQKRYIIDHEGITVGKIRVSRMNDEAWIYGFAIFPKYQGKGIGRKALKNIILEEHQKGYPVFLEVEAKNAHALRLYESCGFKAYHTQDYYQYTIDI